MASRKETPDVLGELLGGSTSPPRPVPVMVANLLPGEGPEPIPADEPKPAMVAESKPVLLEKPKALPASEPALDLVAGVEPVHGRGVSSRPRRTKDLRWEYVEIVFCDHGGFRPRYINGLESRNWKKAPLIYDYLNYLGEQGWELAGVGGRHKGQMPAYVKRLKR